MGHRTNVGDGLMTVFATVAAAYPTLLPEYHRQVPEGINAFPCAWIDARPESITHDSGTRTRSMNPAIVLADRIADNEETSDRLDQLVDAMVEALTDAPQLAPGTIWSNASISDERADMGDAVYAAVRITLQEVTEMVGRS